MENEKQPGGAEGFSWWKTSPESEKVQSLHERYRASGLALSLLIVTLSGGALTTLRPQGWWGLILFLPIALAISHQACLYMAQMLEARAAWNFFVADRSSKHLKDTEAAGHKLSPADRLNAFETGFGKFSGLALKQSVAATEWFVRADCLCFTAVVSFILCGAMVAMQLPAAR